MTSKTTDQASVPHATHDYPGVLDLLRDYYDAYYNLDEAKLRRVFAKTARYSTVSSGELVHLSVDELIPAALARTAPAADGVPYGYTVDTVLFAGPMTALARISLSMFGKDYTDFLSLIHLDGRWQIQAKVFHGEPRAEAV